jgi:hypothetical protein
MKPNDILFDCTHDNPSIYQKYKNGLQALPFLTINSLANRSIGSSWGYDLLIKEKVFVTD